MNYEKRPKLYLPLALLAAPKACQTDPRARRGTRPRRCAALVAAMVD